MSSAIWECLIILVLVLANGIFSGAEIAIINARKGRLRQLADAGDTAAQSALDLAADPNRFLPTVQVGITLLGMFAAAYGGQTLAIKLEAAISGGGWEFLANNAKGIALNIVTLCIATVSLIFGELVPKRLALRHAEGFARLAAPIMTVISTIARPFIWMMGKATNAVLFLLGVRGEDVTSVSLDDIEHLIGTGTAEGLVEPVEQRVALEALRLGERKVRDVMRPRIDLDAIDADTPPEEVLGAAIMAGFSRLPVYEKDLDHILGYVHIKDIFRQQYMGWPLDVRKMMRPALFVPETMPLDRLLHLFQEQHNQLAIVLDEFGGTEGMVTLEDVLQELVGDIHDDHQHDQEQQIVGREDGSLLIDGTLSMSDLYKELELKQSAGDDDRGYSTISGLILDELGRIPKIGETVLWRGYKLEVVDMDGQRIDRILLCTIPKESKPGE
jgi:putative hemolysin